MTYILFSIENGVAHITFNRPEVFNSMHQAMREEILEALDTCARDETVRAVYVTGTGKAFCAGEDLQEVIDPNGPSLTTIISTGYNPIVQKIRNLEKPVVAAINGVAAGAGANIALAGDIVVATASASFTQAFSKIGLIPDSGGTWTLPRLVGFQRASALMMLSDKISALEAAAIVQGPVAVVVAALPRSPQPVGGELRRRPRPARGAQADLLARGCQCVPAERSGGRD